MSELKQGPDLNKWLIWGVTYLLGLLIVVFNVKGYDVLFYDTPFSVFPFISPMGLLLLVAELAVLFWTSAVISNWPNVSKVLKISMLIIIPIFWFICYAGISSYLSSLASKEVSQVNEYKQQAINNKDLLYSLSKESVEIQKELQTLRRQNQIENQKISEFNVNIEKLYTQASERRQTATNCSLVEDCRASVQAFNHQATSLESELEPIRRSRNDTFNRISKLQARLDEINKESNKIKSMEVKKLNNVANSESNFAIKKRAYANTIDDIAMVFGMKFDDSFKVFINILAFVIYPLYFLLNLFSSLQSEQNLSERKRRREETASYRKKKKEYKSLRYEMWRKVVSILRARTLRKKQEVLLALKRSGSIRKEKKSVRNTLLVKAMRYFRVWAARRKKIVEIQVETIVEKEIEVEIVIEVEKVVEIEVEKIVEIEVQVEKEIPVYVDRIVEVPTEIPVYVDKIKTVPEPFFVNDPQIIIHERIIPVPENITGLELEELLNAQPRLNQTSGATAEQVYSSNPIESGNSSSGYQSTKDDSFDGKPSSGEGAAA